MRRANRKDSNHSAIVDGLRKRGIVVYDMPSPGDVLCCFEGRFVPLEFKSSLSIRGKAEDISNNKRKAPSLIPIVHDLGEALSWFGMKE